jgi:hypothetical protein
MFEFVKSALGLGNEGSEAKTGKENPELDKTKEALKKLKDEIDVNKISKADEKADEKTDEINVTEVSKAFEIDLDELGIKDTKEREGYIRTLKERLIAESPELANVNEFVDNVAKYTKLDKLIEQCKKEKSGDPLERFARNLKENVPWLAAAAGWILSFNISKPEAGKKMSKFDEKLSKLAAILTGEEPEESKEKPDTKPETAAAAAETAQEDPLTVAQRAAIAKLDETGFKGVLANTNFFKAKNVSPEDVTKAVEGAIVPNSNFRKFHAKMQESLGAKTSEVELNLANAYALYKIPENKINDVIAALPNIKNPSDVKGYLAAIQESSIDNLNTAIAKYSPEKTS